MKRLSTLGFASRLAILLTVLAGLVAFNLHESRPTETPSTVEVIELAPRKAVKRIHPITGEVKRGVKTEGVEGVSPRENPVITPTVKPKPKAAEAKPKPTPKPKADAKPTKDTSKITGSTYTVKRGDTVGEIAKRAGTTIERVATCSGINPNVIHTGQKLTLKCDKPIAKPKPAPKASTPKAKASGGGGNGLLWTDNVVGKLKNPAKVPCGGLYNYAYAGKPSGKTYYAREIVCNGSARYLSIKKGQKIKIGAKACTMTGSQNLNYRTQNMNHVRWQGNTAVQTCYTRGGGNVKVVYFDCR